MIAATEGDYQKKYLALPPFNIQHPPFNIIISGFAI